MDAGHAAVHGVIQVTKIAAIVLMAFFLVPKTVVEVEPTKPLTSKIMFVVDRSGSLTGDQFSRALLAVRGVLTVPTDDLEVAMIAFNDTVIRWPGRPGGKVPAGWASLPAAGTAREAEEWLRVLGAGGDTLVIPALMAALSDHRASMSIVLVTDGLFGREPRHVILDVIERAQAARPDRAVIAVYGLGPRQQILTEIAEAGGGAYVREPDEVQ